MEKFKKVIGKKLRDKRKSLGLTQEALARLVDTDQSRIARWERGENIPGPRHREALICALQATDGLFGPDEPQQVAKPQALAPETLEAIIKATSEAVEGSLSRAYGPPLEPPDDNKDELVYLVRQLSPEMTRHLIDIVRDFIRANDLEVRERPIRTRR